MADKKAALKEGGKKGVDLDGMSDMGGVKYFNVVVESAAGSLELLDLVLQGMNAPVDESAEERRGGAGRLGKMLLSDGDNTLALLCFIPKDLAASNENVKMAEWMDRLVAAADGKVIQREDGEEVVKVLIQGDAEAGKFPLKMRDAAQSAGFAFLREKGCLPADDSDDDYIPDPEAAGIEW